MQCHATLVHLQNLYPLVQVDGEIYIKSKHCHLYMHVKRGFLIDMDESEEQSTGVEPSPPATHIVTEPTHFDTNAGEMCGYLMMREKSRAAMFLSPRSGGWIRRWFVLQRPLLYFYKSFAKKKELGVIDIARAQVSVHPSDAAAGVPFSFHLSNGKNIWHLQASTATEMRAWLVAIDPLKIDARNAVVNQDFETTAPSA